MNRLVAMIATTLAVMSASPALAGATEVATAAQALTPNKFVWADDASLQPVSVVISIADQRAYVYRGDQLIAASSVSTGKDGKDTPLGVFTILQKKEDHKSNLYDSAPMPFMQRLTWDGVAIHAGRNPGFPASHGCIRMPTAFAKKLFEITNVGTPVLVTDATADEGWTLPDPADATETAAANQQVASYP